MPKPLRLRSALPSLACVCLLPAAACANEVEGAALAASGLHVHSAEQVLARDCRQRDGRLYFELPGGASFELVTSVEDSAILNKGDGSFHPFPALEVASALASLSFPTEGLAAEIYLLPFPRRAGLESAAGPGLVLLSPGVLELSPEQIHAETAHELGHIVQYARMPDADRSAWSRYRELRGLQDETTFNAWAPHAYRPHEIFAEDFRVLFGDRLANYAGGVENPVLEDPAAVWGLKEFMASLAVVAPSAAQAYPNPSRGSFQLRLPARGGECELQVFDLAGRCIRRLAGAVGGSIWSFRWDGTDERGERVPPGAYLARAASVGAPLLLVLLPAR